MNGVRLAKICGVRDLQAIEAARRGGASHIGFVFERRSLRHLTPAEAGALAPQCEGLIRVGLFVDAADDVMAAAAGNIDAFQLHGAESPARALEVKARFGKPVWKALGVARRTDIAAASDWRGIADLVLLDAKPAEARELPGGRGVRFDWELLRGAHIPLPWGLAGGLTAANVGEAIAATGAPLVDTSSGVEDAPGEKNPQKIEAFMNAVRSA